MQRGTGTHEGEKRRGKEGRERQHRGVYGRKFEGVERVSWMGARVKRQREREREHREEIEG